MNLLCRKAQKTDFDIIYQFVCELEKEKFDEVVMKQIFEENIANKNNVYLVAEIENKVVGFISLHSQNLLHHSGKVGEIQEFYLHSDYRNQGIGKLLMNEIKIFTQANNFKSLEVTSNKKRVENVKIYENLGFQLSHNKFTITKFE